MRYQLFFLTLLFIAGSFAARANAGGEGLEGAKKTDITGGVLNMDTKKPLMNVTVTAYLAEKKEKVAMTDSNGNYAFSELKPGSYKLVFEKDGFKKVTREKVVIRPEEGFLLNVEMDTEDEFQLIPGAIFDF